MDIHITPRLKVAVVGAGVSGITAARELDEEHDVTLFEARAEAGGHTRTYPFERFGREYRADLGFMVFNQANYPHFSRMLAELNVPTRDTEMSFSLRCDRSGLEYHGSTMNQLFAQRRNLFRPRHYRMLREILRFNRDARTALAEHEDELAATSVAEFDALVLAVHSDQALCMLEDPTPLERQVLSAIPYQRNEAVVHTDRRVLPKRPLAWASWNYYRDADSGRQASVTYNLNILQHLESPEPICVTLNPLCAIRDEKIITTLRFAHPLFSADAFAAQARVDDMNGAGNRFFCGAWTGWGFNEDGVVSGLKAAGSLREWAADRKFQAKFAYAKRNLRGLGQAYPASTG